ncbi:hypothetical protein [Nocardia sp. NPDC052566]|uniref:hypothetical protein n=1 Tax=Nocardia sp. NPDC052566 TaxID=3364330 RepID=UPI0037C9E441
MKIRAATLLVGAVLAASACSSDIRSPDDQLGDKYYATALGVKTDGAPQGQAKARATAVGAAESQCETLRGAQSRGDIVPTDPKLPKNAAWIREVQEAVRGNKVEPWKMLALMKISAEYKCPEFTAMLDAFS